MATQWTPGPWQVTSISTGYGIVGSDKEGRTIARLGSRRVDDLPNARLIAAALARLVRWADRMGGMEGTAWDAAYALLSDIRGDDDSTTLADRYYGREA
ncbi:MAG: hypothetical protein EXQ94_08040 [Alphaproteobacteria bacterium]|nr:hypothetical protein [Alphaproteobacteria bacterium]